MKEIIRCSSLTLYIFSKSKKKKEKGKEKGIFHSLSNKIPHEGEPWCSSSTTAL